MKLKTTEMAIPKTLKDTLSWKASPEQRGSAIKYHYLKGTESYLIVGFLLVEARDKEDWKKDEIAHNFFEWVEKEETIPRTSAQRFISVWERVNPFLEKHLDLILEINPSNLADVAPLLEGLPEDEALTLLHAAKENTNRDLKNTIKERKGLPTTDTCDHINVQVFTKCERCKELKPTEFRVTRERLLEMIKADKK